MKSGEEAFEKLKQQYVHESLERLDWIARRLETTEKNLADFDALHKLREHFQGLSRSGRTYGFPQVTVLGLQGEYECDAFLRQKSLPNQLDIERWKSLLKALLMEFSKGGNNLTAAKTEAAKTTPRPFEILIVDDDKTTSEMLADLLQKEEMLSRNVQTKEDAIRALGERMPDGIITDILLPDGLGYQLVEYIRGLPDGDKPAVLIVSVLTGFLDKVEAIRSGADGYFEKPVDWDALIQRLQLLLERNMSRPTRILCIESDPAQALYIDTVLGLAGYQVQVCDETKQFEEELAAFQPDLMLVDVLFPRVSGYDIVRYLRQDERYAFLPVVLLAQQGQERSIEVAKALGDGYIVKPISASLLLTMVAAHVERSRFLKSHLDKDGLTRLLTHTAFLEQAKGIVAKKRRSSEGFCAMVMIDLDNFKTVNGRYGHPTGDRVLVSLSSFLRRRVRQSDTKSRYGGEEFAIIIDDIREEEAKLLLLRFLEEFAAIDHHAPDGSVFHVTFSAGVAMFDPKKMDLELWKRAAENALLTAKATGRNRVVSAPKI